MFCLHTLVLQWFLDSHSGNQCHPTCLNNERVVNTIISLAICCLNRIMQNKKPVSSLLHSRSSGLRVSTAAGSTAAMLSAGGTAMPILSKDLQFMVREPISLGPSPISHLTRGFIKPDEMMDITWFCQEGCLYIDGSHVVRSILHGDTIQLSSRAPTLKVYLPPHLLSYNVWKTEA